MLIDEQRSLSGGRVVKRVVGGARERERASVVVDKRCRLDEFVQIKLVVVVRVDKKWIKVGECR